VALHVRRKKEGEVQLRQAGTVPPRAIKNRVRKRRCGRQILAEARSGQYEQRSEVVRPPRLPRIKRLRQRLVEDRVERRKSEGVGAPPANEHARNLGEQRLRGSALSDTDKRVHRGPKLGSHRAVIAKHSAARQQRAP
jgi:hypothetical protein